MGGFGQGDHTVGWGFLDGVALLWGGGTWTAGPYCGVGVLGQGDHTVGGSSWTGGPYCGVGVGHLPYRLYTCITYLCSAAGSTVSTFIVMSPITSRVIFMVSSSPGTSGHRYVILAAL